MMKSINLDSPAEAGIIFEDNLNVLNMSRRNAPAKSEASAVSVTVNLEYESPYAVSSINAYSEEGVVMGSLLGKKAVLALTPGTYTIVTTFVKYKKGVSGRYNNLCGLYYVVKENVVVDDASAPEVNVAVAEASNTYTIKNLLPSGQEATLGSVVYTSKKEYEVVSEGTALFIGVYPAIYHKKHGQILWTSVASQWNIAENEYKNTSDIHDFLQINVNDLSDDCIVGAQCVVNTGTRANHDDFLIEHFELPSVIAQKAEFVNDINDYRIVNQEFTQSQIGRDSQYQPSGDPLALTTEKYWNGVYVGGMGSTMGKTNLCIPKPSSYIPDFNETLTYSYTDMVYDVVVSGNIKYEYGYPSNASPMFIKNDGSMAQMVKTYDVLYKAKAPESIDEWTHPLMRNDMDKIAIPLGSSPTYVSILNTIDYDDGYEMRMLRATPEHKGYAQESQWTLYYTNIFSGKYNGENVEVGMNPWDSSVKNTIEEWLAYDWSEQNMLSGKTELSYRTAPNQVNGVDYLTTCNVEFNTSLDDFVLPLVQHLQFRDAEGNVTYALPTAQGSTLNIVAGDFVKSDDGLYKPSDATVVPTVKYAVSGQSDFKELALTPWSSDDNLPYFAPAYTADLAQVTEKSPEGWYDMTIEMQDASGNKMTQTIAPAFRILANSGITDAFADAGLAVKVSGRNVEILGAASAQINIFSASGAKIAHIEGASASLDNLPAGIYLVEAVADGCHKVVKASIR